MAETTDLRERANAFAELIRPHPHRGDLIAAGAVPLTVALLLINDRMDAAWGTGVFFVLSGLACAFVLAMGVLAPLEGERPRAYQVMLQLCGLALLFVTLMRLAQIFGVNHPLGSSGSAFWVTGVLALVAAWLARERRSEIGTLVAAIAGLIALVSFVGWVFKPHGPATSRWILLLAAIGLVLGALVLRDRNRRNSVYLIDAAGAALLTIGLTYLVSLVFNVALLANSGGRVGAIGAPGGWWSLVLLAGGLGLVAYAGVDREAGPAWLGVLNLFVWILLVGAPGRDGSASLWFWPLVLLAAGAAMIAAGLRPREPLPPEPSRDGRGPAPVVPVTPRGDAATRQSAAPPVSRPAFEGASREDRPASFEPPVPPADQRVSSAPLVPPAPVVPPVAPSSPGGSAEAPPAGEHRASGQPRPGGEGGGRRGPGDEAPTEVLGAGDDEPTRAEPSAPREPEPPGRGSLWARGDRGESPTLPHDVAPREDDDRCGKS